MSFVPLAISAISGLGGLFGNRPQTSTSTTTGTGSSTPNYDPTALGYRNTIIDNYLKMLQPGNIDLSGYEAGQTHDINKLRALQQQRTRESLASRGIVGPAAEFAVNNIDNKRFEDIISLHNQVPLLRQQLQSDILSRAGQFFGSIPYGQNTTVNQNVTAKAPGNQLGGLLGGSGSALAYLYGQGAFGDKNQNNNQAPSYPGSWRL